MKPLAFSARAGVRAGTVLSAVLGLSAAGASDILLAAEPVEQGAADHGQAVPSASNLGEVRPRAFTGDEPSLLALWRPGTGAVGSAADPGDPGIGPWRTDPPPPLPADMNDRQVRVPKLPRPEFTAEAWVWLSPDRSAPPAGHEILALVPADSGSAAKSARHDAAAWTLTLSPEGRLELGWADAGGKPLTVASTVSLADEAHRGRWLHVAIVCRNLGSYFADDPEFIKHKMPKYSLALIYCTPAGAPLPKLVGYSTGFLHPRLSTAEGVLVVGGRNAEPRFPGTIAEAAVSGIAKCENQYPTLGGGLPPGVAISPAEVCGSGRDAVAGEDGVIYLSGGGNGQPSESFNFYFRVDAPPGTYRLCLLPAKGNAAMTATAWVSRDRETWEAPKARQFAVSEGKDAGVFGLLYVEIEVADGPLWVCSVVPYLESDVRTTEAALADWPAFRTEEIGRSHGDRPIQFWTITNHDTPARGKRAFVIISGQHAPAESMGGHVLHAMLQQMRRDPEAARLLDTNALLIAPLINVDNAAEGGNTSLNHNAINLNRDWHSATQPESKAVRDAIDGWVAAGGVIAGALDFHAGGGLKSANHLRVFAPDSLRHVPHVIEQQRLLKSLLDQHLGFGEAHSKDPDRKNFAQLCVDRYSAICFTTEFMASRHLNPRSRTFEPTSPSLLESLGPRLLETWKRYMVSAPAAD